MQRNSRDKNSRLIDYVFYHEKEIRKYVEGGNTDKKINSRPISSPEKWVKVLDMVKDWGDPLKRGLIIRRYRGEDYRKTCMELSITQSTYSLMLKDIRRQALFYAAKLDLIKL